MKYRSFVPKSDGDVDGKMEYLQKQGSSWYAIVCYDDRALENLRKKAIIQDIPLEDQFIPKEWRETYKHGKVQVKLVNTMPGYGFIKSVFSTELFHLVSEIRGCGWHEQGILQIQPVSDEEAERLKNMANRAALVEMPEEPRFVKGEAVKILSGPFKRFEGRVDSGDHYLKESSSGLRFYQVNVQIFGRDTIVEIKESLLKPVEAKE